MPDDFTVEIRGLRELVEKVNDPQLTAGPVRAFFDQAGAGVAGAVRERTPVDTGRLRNSITHEVDRGGQRARVGSNVSYARAVEFGTRPHFPPLAALQPWARRHGFPAGRRGAWLVARTIAVRGTRGAHMFREGLTASAGMIRGLLAGLGRDIEGRWRT